jgi:hypothetical protein
MAILNNKVLSCSVLFSSALSCVFRYILYNYRKDFIKNIEIIINNSNSLNKEVLKLVKNDIERKNYDSFLLKLFYGSENNDFEIFEKHFKVYKNSVCENNELYKGILCFKYSIWDFSFSNKYLELSDSTFFIFFLAIYNTSFFCLLFKILEYNRFCINISWKVIMGMLCVSGIVKTITSLQDKNLDKWWNLSIFKFNVIFSILLISFAVYNQYKIEVIKT